MVLSSACIRVATMAQTVTMPRWATADLCGCVAAKAIARRSEQLGQRAPVPGIDVDGDAHAGAQDRIVRLAIDADAHRDALDDLDPITARVLRRQDRELRPAPRPDPLPAAPPHPPLIGLPSAPHRTPRHPITQLL